jgi:hypothetical protein
MGPPAARRGACCATPPPTAWKALSSAPRRCACWDTHLDLEAVRDDDHVLAVFRLRGHWGALAKSNYSGLRYREPVYRTIRELVMSYFEHYYNLKKEKTLRRYSRPVNLARFDSIDWMTSDDDVWPVPDYLCDVAHSRIIPPDVIRRLGPVDDRLFSAGLVGRTP